MFHFFVEKIGFLLNLAFRITNMLIGYILAYLLITIAIGVYASRLVRNTEDFILAGRRLPLHLATVTIFATWFGSETILGASSTFVEGGMLAVIEEPFGAALCLILVGLFVARPMYRLKLLTFGDFFRKIFGPRVEFISALSLIMSYFGWTAAQLIAMGIIFKLAGGVDQHIGIILASVILLGYTLLGGMWAISLADFLQTIIIVAGLLVTAWIAIPLAGGWEGMTDELPKDFFRFYPPSGWTEWATYIAAWMTIGLGSIPQQDVYQRVMASRSENIAARASIIGGILYLTIGMIPLFLGLAAVQLVKPGDDLQLLLPYLILEKMPFFVQVFFLGALISAVLSTASGSILASSVILSENIIKPLFPSIGAQKFLLVNRVAVVLMTAVGLVMALGRSNIYELVGEASIISLVSLFVPMCAGLFTKHHSEKGAIFSMIGGLSSWYIAEHLLELTFPSLLIGLMVSVVAYVLGTLLAFNF